MINVQVSILNFNNNVKNVTANVMTVINLRINVHLVQ